MLDDDQDCCRWNGAKIKGQGGNPSPQDCFATCDSLEGCKFVSHSTRYKNGLCIFCSACDLSNRKKGKYYSSWAAPPRLQFLSGPPAARVISSSAVQLDAIEEFELDGPTDDEYDAMAEDELEGGEGGSADSGSGDEEEDANGDEPTGANAVEEEAEEQGEVETGAVDDIGDSNGDESSSGGLTSDVPFVVIVAAAGGVVAVTLLAVFTALVRRELRRAKTVKLASVKVVEKARDWRRETEISASL